MVKKLSDKISEETIELTAETLTGDIRDFIIDRMRNFKKPWVAMSEDEQRDAITDAKSAAENLVKLAVKTIAAEGRSVMTGTLDSITVKDGVKAVIKLSKNDPFYHKLLDAAGQAVLVVVADSEPFSGEQAPANPDPDQGDLLDNAKKLKATDEKVTPIK